jgi:rod shape determining protein RodA
MATLSSRQTLRGLDIGLLTITLVLLVVGLAALSSFSLNTGEAGRIVVQKQAGFAIAGIVLIWFIARLDYRFFAGIHWTLYAVTIVMLILVKLFGVRINGTTGWFSIGIVQFQPVEFVKISMSIVLAKYFVDHQDELHSIRGVARSAIVMGIPVLLVLLQPDFGSAFVLMCMWLGMLLILPVPRRFFVILGGIIAVVGTISWFFLLQGYQIRRIETFLGINQDAQGAGYNVKQSTTAIGSGGWFGRGLGLGPQSQLNFIPERQTDFIFATIGEELGFVGAGAVILLYGLLFWRLFRVSGKSEDPMSLLVIMGLAVMFFMHVGVNIGMNMGVFPVTGIPLPFISSGGSALLAGCLAIGLVQSIHAHQQLRLG